MTYRLREILGRDNEQVADLIRHVLTEHDCVGEGYAICDDELNDMYQAYSGDRAAFYVIENESGRILGCGGIAPLAGGANTTCELRKVYFYSELRGQGWGRRMVEHCLDTAKSLGFTRCYLETVDRMELAIALYLKLGFTKSGHPEGNTGHGACDAYYVKNL